MESKVYRTGSISGFAVAALVALLTWMGGCSSSSTTEPSTELSEELPVADASTDALPTDGSEALNAPPPGDLPPEEPIPTTDPSLAEAQPPVDAPVAEPTPDMAAAQPEPMPESVSPPSDSYSTAGGSTGTHTVGRGETLMKIAFAVYGDLYKWRQIYEMNKDVISDPNNVPRGTVLKVEGTGSSPQIDQNGEKYTIQQGDTLGKISNKVYGTPSRWKEIWENNRQLIKNPNKIYAGFDLYYQPGGSTSPMAQSGPSGDDQRMPAAAQAPEAPAAPTVTEPMIAPAPPSDPTVQAVPQ